MPSTKPTHAFSAILLTFALPLIAATFAAAQQTTVLHNFADNTHDGRDSQANLAFDKAGNLYGTTTFGGANGYGTAFKMTPKAGEGWAEKTIYSFNNDGTDGINPAGGLVIDSAGNLYGSTARGGANNFGVVFEISPKAGGEWSEKILLTFNNANGGVPYGNRLLLDSAGNLYGTTQFGGAYANTLGGTVFELSPAADGTWTETILHSFNANGTDGYEPLAGLVLDAQGNLYGTTFYGGAGCCGIVFQLSPSASGNWTETILHSFRTQPLDGYNAVASLIIDAAGNLYGTTIYGGHGACPGGCGTVYQLAPAGDGRWVYKIISSLSDTDGVQPTASVILDSAGNLYGTTIAGGSYAGGTAFKMSPSAGGPWSIMVLENFGEAHGIHGVYPHGGLIFDASGNLYGTNSGGGLTGGGNVFEITP